MSEYYFLDNSHSVHLTRGKKKGGEGGREVRAGGGGNITKTKKNSSLIFRKKKMLENTYFNLECRGTLGTLDN